ncbi:dynein axonemal intermediate chain 4-like [Cochliomyia hominivorax]
MNPPKTTKFSKLTIEDDEKKKSMPAEQRGSLVKTKKVMMDKQDTMSAVSSSITPLTVYERLLLKTKKILDARAQLEVHEKFDNEMVNVTPKPINVPYETERYKKLTEKYLGLQVGDGGGDAEWLSFKSFTSSICKSRSSKGLGFHLSMDDLINGIGDERLQLDSQFSSRQSWQLTASDSSTSSLSEKEEPSQIKYKYSFIRIILRKTELQLLYEQHSSTALKNTEDGNYVEEDNKVYDYLTIGRGKIRRRSEAETQTTDALLKARDVNTWEIKTRDVATYVSYFEMFDTYKMLEDIEYGFLDLEPKRLLIPRNKTANEEFALIAQLPQFHLASVILRRLLAGNVYEQGQRRFRNMTKISRITSKISYKYSLNPLFSFKPIFLDNIRKSVSDMSFCSSNSDILAVSYGIYSYQAAKLPETGKVCVWSIKNPCDAERIYNYYVPVVAVEFSPYIPSLLAIGLSDGSVEVRDITYLNQPPIAVSQRSTSPGVEPVLAIKWIKEGTKSDDYEVIDPFITLSQDGSITQFRIINSPYLAGFKLMTIERIQGSPEGLVESIKSTLDSPHQTNRCAQGLNLTKHPTQMDVYYVLTDEGCVHKCSTNYQHHYLEVLKTHESAVNTMDFSPWSPKLFMTCGNDWTIRIWMEGIFQPLITLTNLFAPYQWAAWSRVHSTILVAINRKQVEIWDIARSILKPMSTTVLGTSNNTMGLFSLDGFSIAIGNARGAVIVNSLDDMPLPPYYQYDNLEKAIYKAVSSFPDLLIELKSIGFFGYTNKGFVIPT